MDTKAAARRRAKGQSPQTRDPEATRAAILKAATDEFSQHGLGGARVDRSAETADIYKRLLESREDIGLATVYRVLTQFEAAGLVTRHHFEDGMAVFELNHGAHHDHIVCLDCGRVEEFVDEGIEERQEAVAARLGFEIRHHALVMYGHCRRPGCAGRPAS